MKYELWATRPAFSTAWSEGFGSFFVKKGLEKMFLISAGEGKVEYFVTQPSFELALKQIEDEALEDVSSCIKKYYSIKRRLIFNARLLGFLARIFPISVLKNVWIHYYKFWSSFQFYILLPHAAERFLEKEIRQKFPKYFDLIISTPKPFDYMLLNRDLFKMSLPEIVKKYSWSGIYSYSEEPYQEDYFANYKNKINTSLEKEIFIEIEENNRKFNTFIKDLNKEDMEKCLLLRELIYIRTDRVDVMRKAGFFTYPFLRKIAKQIDNSFGLKEVSMLSYVDIMGFLRGGKLDIEDLRKRGKRENVVIIFDKMGTRVTCDKKEFELVKQELHSSVATDLGKVNELKGMTAQKGKFKGKVKIYIRDRINWLGNEVGYVFVAKHTMPQDLPYMKNAGAIISDEGGITSHTAVVSRELKIPCIIGTKIATRVLKDGDLVEVDAEKGIVRILKNDE
jgi:phosphohistidine swiveling domain-containing protein